MNIGKVLLTMLLALIVVGAQAQNRRPRKRVTKARTTQTRKPRVPDNYAGTGASVYDLGSDLPEDAAAGKGAVTISVDTIRHEGSNETLIPTAEIDKDFVLQAEASSPLEKVEVCDASGKVLRSQGLHRMTKASVDLNQFPKDQTLVFKFYGVNGNTQNIELSH
jgi:hypothetical protein